MFEIYKRSKRRGGNGKRRGIYKRDKVSQALAEYMEYAEETEIVQEEEASFFVKLWALAKEPAKRVLAFAGGGFIGAATLVSLIFTDASLFHLAFGGVGTGLMAWGASPLLTDSSQKAPALAHKEQLKLPEPIGRWDNSVNEFNKELFNKALADYKKLADNIEKLKSAELKQQLTKMQEIAGKLLAYLQEHPDRISLAERFVNYYQDRAVTLSDEFLEFEKIGLETEEIAQVKRRVINTLSAFDEAYAEQFLVLMRDKIMDVESEVRVAEKIMEEHGVRNKN